MKLFYPAIFIPYMGEYTVEFPDLPGCVTQGENLPDAFEMAQDAACGWILTTIEDNEELLPPSSYEDIVCEEGFVNFVELDIGEYAKQHSERSVKKTLTIPQWLNNLAQREGINFSKELQTALIKRLGLTVNSNYISYYPEQDCNNFDVKRIELDGIAFESNAGITTATSSNVSNIIPFPAKSYLDVRSN